MTKTLPELTLPISGMTCASCVSHVEEAFKELPGISNVTINPATNKANLTNDHQRLIVDRDLQCIQRSPDRFPVQLSGEARVDSLRLGLPYQIRYLLNLNV